MKNKLFNNPKSLAYKPFYYFFWTMVAIGYGLGFFLAYHTFITMQWENANNTISPLVVKILLGFNCALLFLLYGNNLKELLTAIINKFYLRKRIFKEAFWNRWGTLAQLEQQRVFVLYTTCDDFEWDCLQNSLKQTHKNTQFWILDDSKKPFYKKLVDEFVAKHEQVKLFRRKIKEGFKAGNINHFLRYRNDYDYFVVLDKDSIIPKNFITKALRYFVNPEVGIVQANNQPIMQKNWFDLAGSYVHNYTQNAEFNVRDRFGILNCHGHGMMVSKKAYWKANGFPQILLEDWGISFKALQSKYTTIYANDIICYEKFPVDYLSFKRRQYRWTTGGVQFFVMMGYKTLFLKNVPFGRKYDFFYYQTSFIITIAFVLINIINSVILYPLGFQFNFSIPLSVITTLMVAIPVFNCFLFYVGQINFFKAIAIALFFYVLYASLFVSSIRAICKGLFVRKHKYYVTRNKEQNQQYGFKQAVAANWLEIVVGCILLGIFFILSFSFQQVNVFAFIWLLVLSINCFLSVILTIISQKKCSQKAIAYYMDTYPGTSKKSQAHPKVRKEGEQ